MICPHCGVDNNDANTYCFSCNTPLSTPTQEPASFVPPMENPAPAPVQSVPNYYPPYPPAQPTIPDEYKPLSAWAYFGYNLLFSIPLVGFILLIVFSVSDGNINRRNYARSFFCALLVYIGIVALLAILAVVIVLATGASLQSMM